MDRQEYKKKEKIYVMLGAKQMEKFVLFLERIKYKFIKKCIPNFYLKKGTELITKKRNSDLKKLKKRKEKDLKNVTKINKEFIEKEYAKEEEQLIAQYKTNILLFKKQYYDESNLNYHIDSNNPLETKTYLEWNKSVHKRGLIKNAIVLPIALGASIIGFTPAIPVVAYELLESFINFECINLQNYNINRLERIDKVLKKRASQNITKLQESAKKYGDAQEVIAKTVRNEEDIATVDDIISNIKTKEQAEQMKELLLKKLQARNKCVQQGVYKKAFCKGE